MKVLNKKDLKGYNVFDSGYCSLQNITKSDLVIELGYNHGLYGWNWSAYLIKGTNAVLLNSYRNGLKEWFKNFSAVRSELEEINRQCDYFWKKTEEEKAQILKSLQEIVNR